MPDRCSQDTGLLSLQLSAWNSLWGEQVISVSHLPQVYGAEDLAQARGAERSGAPVLHFAPTHRVKFYSRHTAHQNTDLSCLSWLTGQRFQPRKGNLGRLGLLSLLSALLLKQRYPCKRREHCHLALPTSGTEVAAGEKQVLRTQSLELSLEELTSPRMVWGCPRITALLKAMQILVEADKRENQQILWEKKTKSEITERRTRERNS